MAYTAHTVIKPEKIVATGIGVLSQELTLPKLFMRKNYEDIKGALDDTLTFRVPGRLVPRRWAWRNNRSTPIVYDVYKEAKTTLTYGDRIYSAVKITDEQAQFGRLAEQSDGLPEIVRRRAELAEGALRQESVDRRSLGDQRDVDVADDARRPRGRDGRGDDAAGRAGPARAPGQDARPAPDRSSCGTPGGRPP